MREGASAKADRALVPSGPEPVPVSASGNDPLRVRVTQLDGKLPNLALMRLAAWHRAQGDDVRWERGTARQLHEPAYDVVYGSAIFATTAKAVVQFRKQFPDAIVGGSGGDAALRVEDVVPSQFTGLDYSGYPDFTGSIGYAMRGCRFKCGFCVVPKQEGRARSNATIAQIWRGPGFPKHLHLLDNDFFGNPNWRDVVKAINSGGFRVCINQGINVRLLNAEQASAMASMRVMDDQFKTRRIYTAWDNIGDEEVFFRGVTLLEEQGVNPDSLMVYMLVGYDPRETWERIWHRYTRMMERKVRPYPMVHDRFRHTKPDLYRKLKQFQGWIIRGTHKTSSFEEFRADHRRPEPDGELLSMMAATAAKRMFAQVQEIRASGMRPKVVMGENGIRIVGHRDSGRLPKGEDSRSEAECAASQSGGATSAASPDLSSRPSNREAT